MRLAKRSTYVTFIISVISLTGIILLRNQNQLIYDIALALFGSSVLAFIIAILEYAVEKKTSLFKFYKIAYNISNSLSYIVYYRVEGQIKDIVERVQENYPDMLISDFNFFQNDEHFSSCVNSYISISEIEIDELKNSYGNLDFLFSNSFFRKWIEKNIYSDLIQVVDSIKQKASSFQFLMSSKNAIYCLKPILELNDRMFSEEYDETGNVIVYNRVYYEISENVERLRCKIQKQKYEQTKYHHIVFMQITKHIEI